MTKMDWERVRLEERAGERLDTPSPRRDEGDSITDAYLARHGYGTDATPIKCKPSKNGKRSKAKQGSGYRQCKATAKSGEQCKGGAMRGTPYCGPHQEHQGHRCYLCGNSIKPSSTPGRRPITWRDDEGIHHAHPECAKSWMTSTPSRGGDEPRAVEET